MLFHRLIVTLGLCAVVAGAYAATTVGSLEPTSGTWRAYRGSGFSTLVCSANSEAGVLACAAADAERRAATTRYQIRYPNRYVTVAYAAAPPPPVTPPPASDALFSCDFEAGLSCSQNGISIEGQTGVVVDTTNPISGSRSARFVFGPNARGQDAFAELRLRAATPMPDVWVSYRMRVPANYFHRSDSPSNNKGFLYAWDAGSSDSYGSPHVGMGPNLWANGDGTSHMTHYVWGRNSYGDKHFWTDESASYYPNGRGIIERADLGKTMTVVVHYKYASAANNDGVAEIWKVRDGVAIKLLDIQRGAWYSVGQKGFGSFYVLGWANSGFDQRTEIQVDDLKISAREIPRN